MKDKKILIFAGTYEGRKLCEYFCKSYNNIIACVATEYGKDMLVHIGNIIIHEGRLTEVDMENVFIENGIELVLDATHPYAKEVTINIKSACKKTNTKYYRLLREEENGYSNIITVKDTNSAVEYLKNTTQNVLVTTGSKELHLFSDIENYTERLYVRVLPSADAMEYCNSLGYKGRHIIGMQGPFSQELNIAIMEEFSCKYIVTKNTGTAGGLDEKISAANKVGAKTILIDRPVKEVGYSFEEIVNLVLED